MSICILSDFQVFFLYFHFTEKYCISYAEYVRRGDVMLHLRYIISVQLRWRDKLQAVFYCEPALLSEHQKSVLLTGAGDPCPSDVRQGVDAAMEGKRAHGIFP